MVAAAVWVASPHGSAVVVGPLPGSSTTPREWTKAKPPSPGSARARAMPRGHAHGRSARTRPSVAERRTSRRSSATSRELPSGDQPTQRWSPSTAQPGSERPRSHIVSVPPARQATRRASGDGRVSAQVGAGWFAARWIGASEASPASTPRASHVSRSCRLWAASVSASGHAPMDSARAACTASDSASCSSARSRARAVSRSADVARRRSARFCWYATTPPAKSAIAATVPTTRGARHASTSRRRWSRGV